MQSKDKNTGPTKKVIEVTGILIPTEWDENANPTQFVLSAYDEQEYLIENLTALCDRPRNLLRKKIKIIGETGRKIKKKRVITISRFDLLEEDQTENIL
ncbi:MAG: hypothetical protein KKB94_05515 [Proteobacteria bacterium]|nr:hypothetical protein [Pseudomonadota bacterium]